MAIDFVALARFLLTGIALLLAFLAIVMWSRRRDAAGAGTFSVLIASMAVYAFGYAGEIAQTSITGAQRWLDVEYLAVPWAGGLWVLAACRHNRVKAWAPLLFVIPLLTFLAHYSNFHGLFYSGPMTLVHRGPFWVLDMHRGPLSVLDNAYLFVSFFAGSWIYISGYRHASDLYRKQALVLVLCSFLPFIGYFLYLSNLTPYGLDVTPVTLGLTCLCFYYGMFYCGIFELAPLGRNLIFNSIRDAVLILDVQGRLLDFNPAATLLLPVLNKRALGKESEILLADCSPGLLLALRAPEESGEFELQLGEETLWFELRSWPIFADGEPGSGNLNKSDRAGSSAELVGRAVIFADISAQVRLREELRRQSETDPLTGIANRRRFHQALEIECLRFTRGYSPFSVLMLDLDNFKDVNDRYGHPAGDAVLRRVAEILLLSLRKTDLPARYGGEEFAVLLSDTPIDGARVIAERIRAAVSRHPVDIDDHQIAISISVGIANHASDSEGDSQLDPQILLKKADLALYRAKAAGRNRVEVV